MPKPKIARTSSMSPASSASPGDFVTVREVTGLLKLSEITVRRMLTQKKLKRYKVGARTLIRKSEALALIRVA